MEVFITSEIKNKGSVVVDETRVKSILLNSEIGHQLTEKAVHEQDITIFIPSLSRLLYGFVCEMDLEDSMPILISSVKSLLDFYKENTARCNLILVSIGHGSKKKWLPYNKSSDVVDYEGLDDSELHALTEYVILKEFALKKLDNQLKACSDNGKFVGLLDANLALKAFKSSLSSRHNLERIVSEKCEKQKKDRDEFREKEAELLGRIANLEKDNILYIDSIHQAQELLVGKTNDEEKAISESNAIKLKCTDLQSEITKLEAVILSFEKKVSEQERKIRNQNSLINNLSSEGSSLKSLVEKVKGEVKQAELAKTELIEKQKVLELENKELVANLYSTQELLEEELNKKQSLSNNSEKLSKRVDALDQRLKQHGHYQSWLIASIRKANSRLWSSNLLFRRRIKKQAQLAEECGLFNSIEYLEYYPDVRESGVSPELHYLLFGAYECRNPSSSFNTLNYIEAYPDVAKSGAQPLEHFMLFGKFENRKADPFQKLLPSPKSKDKL